MILQWILTKLLKRNSLLKHQQFIVALSLIIHVVFIITTEYDKLILY